MIPSNSKHALILGLVLGVVVVPVVARKLRTRR